VSDVDELYRLFSRRLLRIVRSGVRAPDSLIEDACQFAWSRLVDNRARVHRDTALSWLITTAMREARKLVQRSGRDLSLEAVIDQGAELPGSRTDRSPQALAEARERLRSVTLLPARQQRLLWLYGVGLSYEEIARSQGCTSRTVERQLHSARATLRARDDRAPAHL
jgi:RNA polymerase sigma factor (sigma-70 family)